MTITRRTTLSAAFAFGAAALIGLPAHANEVNLGKSSSIKIGAAKVFSSGSNRVLVFRFSSTKYLAFRSACPNDGTVLLGANVKGNRVTCPSDKAVFGLQNGKSLSGKPATLESVKLRVSKGFLLATLAATPTPTTSSTAKPLIQASKVPLASGIRVESSVGVLMVVQPQPGMYAAFSAVCTHAGCEVTKVTASSMLCTCHNSEFSTADGAVSAGPARQPLKQYPLTEKDGFLYL